MAYDRIDPIGEWRDDFRTAHIISTLTNIVNVMFSKKGDVVEMTKPTDFMVDWGQETEVKSKQKIDDLSEKLKSWADSHNRSIERSKEKNEVTKIKKKK